MNSYSFGWCFFFFCFFFFFNDTATTEIYTLSLHDALPIFPTPPLGADWPPPRAAMSGRSEEHTSELQSHVNLVCRLLLEKKKKNKKKLSIINQTKKNTGHNTQQINT